MMVGRFAQPPLPVPSAIHPSCRTSAIRNGTEILLIPCSRRELFSHLLDVRNPYATNLFLVAGACSWSLNLWHVAGSTRAKSCCLPAQASTSHFSCCPLVSLPWQPAPPAATLGSILGEPNGSCIKLVVEQPRCAVGARRRQSWAAGCVLSPGGHHQCSKIFFPNHLPALKLPKKQ